jgi:hypothetical protein
MYRLSMFFEAGFDEAEELAERLADQLHEHTREGTEPGKLGYFISLTAVDEPGDRVEFLALVGGGAQLLLFGPNDESEGE